MKDDLKQSDTSPEIPEDESTEIIFRGECDLHHFPPAFTRDLILEFIHQSKLQGLKTIRLIYGKGRSQKKLQAYKILASHPDVASFSDDRANWGAAVIILK